MNQSIFTHDYKISTFLVNAQRRLGLVGLLNIIQDASLVHATELGHGYEEMLSQGVIWVLTRQKLKMNRWPSWGETLHIKTWVRPIQSVIAYRDFEFYVNDEKIGECSTGWLTLDPISRKPKIIDLKNHSVAFRTDYQIDFDASKIERIKDAKSIAEFKVRNSDIDMHHHVNNTRYAQWILDAVDREKHQQFIIKEYEVNFLAEVRELDEVIIQKSDVDLQLDDQWVYFQGIRSKNNDIIFTSRILIKRT